MNDEDRIAKEIARENQLDALELSRRLKRRLVQGKGVFLSAEDLEILAATGVVSAFSNYTSKLLETMAKERLDRRLSGATSKPEAVAKPWEDERNEDDA